MATTTGLSILITAQNQASGAIDAVRSSLTGLAREAKGTVADGLEPIRNLLATGLKAAAVTAAGAIAGFAAEIGASVRAAGDMQQGVADIGASMSASAEETEKLRRLILDLGIDPKLKVTATEASQAIGQLGTAGVSVSDILGGAARNTVLLANATGADFTSSASMASDVMHLWGISASDLGKAVDGIASSVINSKFTIQDYSYALGAAGGVAATTGVGFDDFNTSIAAMSPFFATGSDAGTSFKVMLQNLVPKSKATMGTMKDLGLITKESGNLFFDANGKMKDMADIVQVLHSKLGSLSEENLNDALHKVFGTDAMRAAAALTRMTKDEYVSLQQAMSKTNAEEMAAKRMGTFKGAVEILGGVFETLQIQIGDKFLPTFTTLIQRFTEMLSGAAPAIVDWAGQFANALQSLGVKWLPILVTKLQEWWQIGQNLIGPLSEIVKQLGAWVVHIVAAVQPIADLIARFVTWKDVAIAAAGIVAAIVIPALAGMVAAFAPVVAVVAGAIAIVATLRNAWEVNFGGIRTLVQALATYLQERFGLLFAVVRDYGGGALREILAWVNGTETQFRNLSFLWDVVKNTAQLFFADMVKYVQTNLTVWVARLAEWGAAAWQWIVNVTPILLGKLAEWGNALLGWVTTNLPGWVAKLASWGAAAWQWIVNVTPTLLGELGKWLGALIGWLGQQLPTFLATMLRWGTALFTWVGDAIPRAIQGLVNLVTGMTSWGNSTGQQGLASMVVGWATTLIKWIAVDLIPTVGPELLKFGLAMLTYLGKIGLSLAEAALKLGVSIITAIAEGLLNLVGIGANLSGVRDYLFSVITGWRQGLLSKGGEIVAALRDGLVAAQQWARDGINAVLDYLQSGNDQRLNGFGQALYSAGQGAIQKLGQGFQAAKEFAGGQIQQIMDDVQQRGVAFAAGAFAGRLYEAARNAMIQFGSGLLAGSPNLAGDLSRALDGLVNAFNWFMDPFKNHVFAAATDIGGRITAGLASLNGAAAIQGPLNNLVNGFNMVIEPLKNHFFSAASDLAGRIGSGLASLNGAAAIQGPLGNLGNAFNAVMDPLKAHVFAASADLGAKISAGLAAMDPAGAMRDGLWKIIDAFNYVMDGFKAHVWGVMSDIGGRISNGLAEGIRGTMQAVFDALDWIASYAPQWVKDKLGIHSPSRVFMDMGSNIMEGLAQGIEALSSAPQAALQTATAGLTDLAAGGQGGSTTVNYNRTVQTSNTFNVGGGNVGGRDPFEAVRVLNALYGQA